MPKISEEFTSNFLKAADFGGKDVVYTIESAAIESFKEDDGSKRKKVVLAFEETEQKLVVNTTNRDILVELYGDDTDDWIGKKIILYPAKVTFAGKRVEGIRVRDRVPKKGAVTKPAQPEEEEDGDDPPF